MEEAKEDVRADIAVMKRAAEKADSEVTKAELEKKKQVEYTVNKERNKQTRDIKSCPLFGTGHCM